MLIWYKCVRVWNYKAQIETERKLLVLNVVQCKKVRWLSYRMAMKCLQCTEESEIHSQPLDYVSMSKKRTLAYVIYSMLKLFWTSIQVNHLMNMNTVHAILFYFKTDPKSTKRMKTITNCLFHFVRWLISMCVCDINIQLWKNTASQVGKLNIKYNYCSRYIRAAYWFRYYGAAFKIADFSMHWISIENEGLRYQLKCT